MFQPCAWSPIPLPNLLGSTSEENLWEGVHGWVNLEDL